MLDSDEWCLVTCVKVTVSSFPCAVWVCLRILVSPPGVRYFAGKAHDRFCAAACLDAAWESGFPQRVAAQVRLIGGTADFVKLWLVEHANIHANIQAILSFLSYFVLPNTFYSVSSYLFFLFLFSHRKVSKELRNGHNKLVIEIRVFFCYGAPSAEKSWRPPPLPQPIKRVHYKFDVV